MSEIVLRRDLVADGFTDDEIRAAVRMGEAERICRGAFGAPIRGDDDFANALTRYSRMAVAHGRRLSGAVLSHASASVVYRMPVPSDQLYLVHASRPGCGGSRRAGALVVHSARLLPAEITTVAGVRVTTAARTVIDMVRTLPLADAVALADDALHRGLVTPADLVHALQSARYRRGMPAARRALALVDGRSESVGETRMRLAIRGLGLPPLEPQCDVYSAGDVFLGRSDAAYPEAAVLVEFDGLVKYRTLLRPGEDATGVVIREKLREDRLTEAGFVVVRLTWADLGNRATLLRRLDAAIERGRRSVAAGLVTGRCVLRKPMVVSL